MEQSRKIVIYYTSKFKGLSGRDFSGRFNINPDQSWEFAGKARLRYLSQWKIRDFGFRWFEAELSFTFPLRVDPPPYEHGAYKNPGYQEN